MARASARQPSASAPFSGQPTFSLLSQLILSLPHQLREERARHAKCHLISLFLAATIIVGTSLLFPPLVPPPPPLPPHPSQRIPSSMDPFLFYLTSARWAASSSLVSAFTPSLRECQSHFIRDDFRSSHLFQCSPYLKLTVILLTWSPGFVFFAVPTSPLGCIALSQNVPTFSRCAVGKLFMNNKSSIFVHLAMPAILS